MTADDVLAHSAVIIPAFNAGAHLGDVLEAVGARIPPQRIIVVDDGSSDETVRVANDGGADLISHPTNLGKGAALATGIRRAAAIGARWAFTMDADGQHSPDDMPLFAAKIAETGAAIVVGNRMGETRDMPGLRRWTNRTTSSVVSFLARQQIPDSQNGYRLLDVEAVKDIPLVTSRYDTESELLIKAGKRGLVIADVPIQTIYGDEVSSINPIVDTARFFRLVAKALFW